MKENRLGIAGGILAALGLITTLIPGVGMILSLIAFTCSVIQMIKEVNTWAVVGLIFSGCVVLLNLAVTSFGILFMIGVVTS